MFGICKECSKNANLDYAILFVHMITIIANAFLPYLPTPPLGKDMTQGQFLCGV